MFFEGILEEQKQGNNRGKRERMTGKWGKVKFKKMVVKSCEMGVEKYISQA